jgi:hypothetical protein
MGATHEVVGKRRELLDPADGNILDALLFTFLKQSMVYLA